MSMRTLFLQAPSFDGFDGGAGSRYQAKREIRSFWFPTWLAQPAALVPNSKLIDAPPADITLATVVAQANDFDLCVVHTSVPSFDSDVKCIAGAQGRQPQAEGRLIGAKVAVEGRRQPASTPRSSTSSAATSSTITIKEVADGAALVVRSWGLSYRNEEGFIVHNPDRPILETMDDLPSVIPVYQRDLRIEDYFIGYLKHPYLSVYTGRGCKSRCTFCLWPQTVGGHRYRTRSVENVVAEIADAKRRFPQVKEFFFDDDTFTDDLPRAEAIAEGLGQAGRHL